MVCECPALAAAGTYSLQLRVVGYDAPPLGVLPVFTVSRPSDNSISSLMPGGGSYNLVTTVWLTGDFLDFGNPIEVPIRQLDGRRWRDQCNDSVVLQARLPLISQEYRCTLG